MPADLDTYAVPDDPAISPQETQFQNCLPQRHPVGRGRRGDRGG